MKGKDNVTPSGRSLRFQLYRASAVIAAILLITGIPRPAAANVISFSGFTVPQTAQFSPDSTCAASIEDLAFPDGTCGFGSAGSATLKAADGTVILSLTSSYGISLIGEGGLYAGMFQLKIAGNVDYTRYNGSSYVAVEPGNEIGDNSNDIPGPAPNPVIQIQSDPNVDFDLQSPFGSEWVSPGEPIYMGTSFQENGSTYYGWFEFSYALNFDNEIFAYAARNDDTPNITLDGYAYESCPNMPIVIGATQGGADCASDPPPDPPAPEPATLGLLLSGVPFLLWTLRRRRAA